MMTQSVKRVEGIDVNKGRTLAFLAACGDGSSMIDMSSHRGSLPIEAP
jgi:hypothetical protein